MTTPATDTTAALTPHTTSVRGRFLWYDLIVPDVEAATRFYGAVAGWTTTAFPSEDGKAPYLMWVAGDRPVGGVTATPAEAEGPPAYWMAHIGTPDLEATYAAALERGARGFVPPTDIPTVGRFAILTDPQGAAFAMYEPAASAALVDRPAETPGVGGFSWHELATTAPDAAFDFYAQLFGWERTEAMDMGPMGVYQMYGHGGTTYGGIFNSGQADVPPHWLLYVHVADLGRALDAVRAGGGQVLNGPMEVPGGDHIAQCRDPQGAAFALHASARG